MNLRVWTIRLAAMMIVAASARGQDAAPKLKITTAQDVGYTKVGDRELKLDLAAPAEGDGPFPGIVVIHGGAWRAGDKKDLRELLNECARRGYVAISPQYRFCPQETFPAQVYDVKAAVRWLRSHAKDYTLDADHLGATGFSAGGHLALMLGVTGPDDKLEGDVSADAPSSRVQAVVNYFGPTDLGASDIPDPSKPLVRDFVGGTPAEKPDEVRRASPLIYVTRDDAPTLTFQGTKDGLVPYTQATKLADAMTASGVPGRVELMIGADHGWGGAEMKHTIEESFAFFDQYLKPKAKP